MKRKLTCLVLVCLTCTLWAQDDLVYRMELGGTVGTSFYLGDVNKAMYRHSGFAGGAIARFLLNPRMAVKTNLTYGQIKGNTDNLNQFYPADVNIVSPVPRSYAFSGGIFDLSATYEYNFLPYGKSGNYQNYSSLSPYLQLGAGFTYADKPQAFTLNIPVGIGIKYKLSDRVNVGLDWAIHFTLSDKLDALDAPYAIAGSGFKNKDSYTQTLLFFTYDMSPHCMNCNKDE